jgi:hypothetical protein
MLEWNRSFVIDPKPSKMHNVELMFIVFYLRNHSIDLN